MNSIHTKEAPSTPDNLEDNAIIQRPKSEEITNQTNDTKSSAIEASTTNQLKVALAMAQRTTEGGTDKNESEVEGEVEDNLTLLKELISQGELMIFSKTYRAWIPVNSVEISQTDDQSPNIIFHYFEPDKPGEDTTIGKKASLNSDQEVCSPDVDPDGHTINWVSINNNQPERALTLALKRELTDKYKQIEATEYGYPGIFVDITSLPHFLKETNYIKTQADKLKSMLNQGYMPTIMINGTKYYLSKPVFISGTVEDILSVVRSTSKEDWAMNQTGADHVAGHCSRKTYRLIPDSIKDIVYEERFTDPSQMNPSVAVQIFKDFKQRVTDEQRVRQLTEVVNSQNLFIRSHAFEAFAAIKNIKIINDKLTIAYEMNINDQVYQYEQSYDVSKFNANESIVKFLQDLAQEDKLSDQFDDGKMTKYNNGSCYIVCRNSSLYYEQITMEREALAQSIANGPSTRDTFEATWHDKQRTAIIQRGDIVNQDMNSIEEMLQNAAYWNEVISKGSVIPFVDQDGQRYYIFHVAVMKPKVGANYELTAYASLSKEFCANRRTQVDGMNGSAIPIKKICLDGKYPRMSRVTSRDTERVNPLQNKVNEINRMLADGYMPIVNSDGKKYYVTQVSIKTYNGQSYILADVSLSKITWANRLTRVDELNAYATGNKKLDLSSHSNEITYEKYTIDEQPNISSELALALYRAKNANNKTKGLEMLNGLVNKKRLYVYSRTDKKYYLVNRLITDEEYLHIDYVEGSSNDVCYKQPRISELYEFAECYLKLDHSRRSEDWQPRPATPSKATTPAAPSEATPPVKISFFSEFRRAFTELLKALGL